MGAVVDRSTVDLALVKTALGLNGTAQDDFLTLLLDAAKEDADDFLGNDFTDDDDNELDIPKYIDRWVLKEVIRDYENRPNGLMSEAIGRNGGPVTWSERCYKGLWRKWKPRI